MSDRKRSWFQLHLSTCVVLMIVAGALAWVNVLDYSVVVGLEAGREVRMIGRGWPESTRLYFDHPVSGSLIEQALDPGLDAYAVNVAVALAILAAAAFACERWVSRRVRGKDDPA